MEFHWSGQIIEPIDGLAFMGRNPGDKNIYVATGDSGNGMTHGTIAGILLTDLILGGKTNGRRLYDPSRISLRAAPEFARENLNSWFNISDYATRGRPRSASEKFQPVPEHWSGKNSRSWPSTGIAMGPCTNAPPYVLIWAALWLGTTPKKLGIAPATDLASTLTAKFLTVQQIGVSSMMHMVVVLSSRGFAILGFLGRFRLGLEWSETG